jgi:hypothetical protein
MYTKEVEKKVEDRLLATHLSTNPDFEPACYAGDGQKIMSIIETEMSKNNLFTKGSMKLKADIIRMLQGRTKVSYYVGQEIVKFVWYARLAGSGNPVIK